MSAFDAVSPDVLNKDVMKKARQAIRVVHRRGKEEGRVFENTLLAFFGLAAAAFTCAQIGNSLSAYVPHIVPSLLNIAGITLGTLGLPAAFIRGDVESVPLSEMRRDIQAYKQIRNEALAHPEDQIAQGRYRLAVEGYLPKLQATLDSGGKKPTEAQMNKARAKFFALTEG